MRGAVPVGAAVSVTTTLTLNEALAPVLAIVIVPVADPEAGAVTRRG